MAEYELRCIHDNRKSFYQKAKVRYEGDRQILKSYSTDVAYIENGKARVNGMYSQTTLRHIKEFLKQNGFKAETWAQMEKDYSMTEEEIKTERAEQQKRQESMLKSVAMVSKLGDIFGQTKKESNDWKVRMLKAGLENKGFSMPEDWETLSETDKERRLNGAIEQIA